VTRSRLDERIAAPRLGWLRGWARRTVVAICRQNRTRCDRQSRHSVSQGTRCMQLARAGSAIAPSWMRASSYRESRLLLLLSNVRHWDQTNLTKHNLVLPALHSGTDPSVGGCFVPPLVIGLRVHGASGRPTHVGKARADQAFEPSLESISPNRHLYRCGCAHASSHRTLRRWPVLPSHKLAVDAAAGT
jgi:hypothetical protein